MIVASVFLGLIVGSFLNVVILRMEKGEGFLRGRSRCFSCGRELAWRDMVPVVSFIILKGRCRLCGAPISWQYPLIEATSALMFALAFLAASSFAELAFFLVAGSLLIILFAYDMRWMILPDAVLFPLIVLAGLWRVVESAPLGWHTLIPYGIAMGVASGFFLLIYLASRGVWMGFGDVKLALVMGLLVGWPFVLVALFLAFFLGALAGLALMAIKKKGMRSEMPFAPFLILGTVAAFFAGDFLLSWYLALLFFA